MNNIIIHPKKLSGKIIIPPSKSMAHRLIICSAMAKGKSIIKNVSYSEDILATIDAMTKLGAKITKHEDFVEVDGSGFYTNKNMEIQDTINCNESGTTLRFLIPLSILKNNNIGFSGKGKLPQRPLNIFYDIFDKQKISYNTLQEENFLQINGKLEPGKFIVDGGVSSQFISGLLLALPLLDSNSVIKIKGNLESKPYIDLTIQAMEAFGVTIKSVKNGYYIKANQKYSPSNQIVEGDYSQGAFFLVAKELGSNLEILGLKEDSNQGDKEIIDIINKMKASDKLISIDGQNIPDIIPISALLACGLNKNVEFYNISRLKIKESDRLAATWETLYKLGYDISISEDQTLIIKSMTKNIKTNNIIELDSFNDHRIAMMIAIASTISDTSVILKNSQSVSKSFPDFWDKFKELGGDYEQHMGK